MRTTGRSSFLGPFREPGGCGGAGTPRRAEMRVGASVGAADRVGYADCMTRRTHLASRSALLVSLVFAACGFDSPHVTNVELRPYSPVRGQKFVTICLNRELGRNESYFYDLRFVLDAGVSRDCNGMLSNGVLGGAKSCFRQHLAGACLRRHSTVAERALVDERIAPGKVRSVTVRLTNTIGTPRKTVGEWSFGPM